MSFLAEQRRDAVAAVAAWVQASIAGAMLLDQDELRSIERDADWDGWRLPLPEGRGALHLLLDLDFPYSLPRFGLEGRIDLLQAPHVELKGKLCLAGDGGRADTLNPVAVVAYSYHEALALVAEDEAGGNLDDFTLDFDAYWRRGAGEGLRLLTWLGARNGSREISAWHGKDFYFVADHLEDAALWLENRYGSDASRTFHPAAYIWLEKLPEPSAYPVNTGTLRRLVEGRSATGLPIFDRLMRRMESHAAVILGGPSANGQVALAGVVVDNPGLADTGKAPRARVTKGFRQGNVPAQILALRRPARRLRIERVDGWLGRVHSGEGEALSSRRVAVIGCGSLGAGVAKILLQSGVGRLTLIDPDTFDWANLGRHELGAADIGKNKASALAAHFKPMYPHAREIVAAPSTWQAMLRDKPDAFSGVDLILSLIGDWNAESAINDLQRAATAELTAPVLYGWMEDQAGAAHALLIGGHGACLRCGFGPTGTIRIPATQWRAQGPVGCGAQTSLYGAVDLAPAQALVASLAIDLLLGRVTPPVRRTWLASVASLAAAGGHWHPAWINQYGDPQRGGVLTATPWPEDPACPSRHLLVTSGAAVAEAAPAS